MSKKQSHKKIDKTENPLNAAESQELEIILDRLSVQNPAGESLENLLGSLRSSLAGRENLVSALLEKVSRNPSEVGFQTFQRLQDLVVSKTHRRAIRQAAYRFEQRGYTVEAQTAATEKVVLIPKEVRSAAAHMVPADRELWFISAFIPDSKFYTEPVSVAVFAEGHLRRAKVREVEGPYKKYKELIQLVTNTHARPCEIPMWHAARLVRELVELCDQKETSPEIERVRQMLERYDDPQKMPFVYELMPEDDESARPISEEETHWFLNNVNISPLLYEPQDLDVYRQKILAIDQSVLDVPREVQTERVLDLTRKMADELCVGKVRLVYQRFFEEQAVWLKLSSEDELAVLAWRTAQHLRNIERVSDNPVVHHLAILSLRHHWPQDFEEKASETQTPFMETESGLILPR